MKKSNYIISYNIFFRNSQSHDNKNDKVASKNKTKEISNNKNQRKKSKFLKNLI